MIRIHNPALLRILTVIIGFSVIYNILAMYDDFLGMEYVSLTIIPVLFLISINLLNKRSSFWLLLPLSLYFFDRFIVYIVYGVTNLREGYIFFDQFPMYGLFLQTNGLRFILTLLVTFLLISFITSAQKIWFYKLRKFVTILLLIQMLEYGFYLFNELGQSSISIVEMILVIPNYFYFVIMASFMTRIHLFEIYTEMGNLEEVQRRSPEAIRKAQLKKMSQKVENSNPVKPQTPARPAPQNHTPRPQYHNAAPQRPYQVPKAPIPQARHNQTPYPKRIQTCPQCGESNQSPPMCKKCGEALR